MASVQSPSHGGQVNSSIKTIIFWAVLICFAVLLWTVLHASHTKEDQDAELHRVHASGD